MIRIAAYCIVFSLILWKTQTRIWKHWQLYLHAIQSIQWYSTALRSGKKVAKFPLCCSSDSFI